MKTSFFVLVLVLSSFVSLASEKSDSDLVYSNEVLSTYSFEEAMEFMAKRCENIDQMLVDGMEYDLEGNTIYLFLSVSTDNVYGCVSTITPYALDVIAADCDYYSVKSEQWLILKGIY